MSISNRSRDLLTQTCLPPSGPYSTVQELSAQTEDSHAQGLWALFSLSTLPSQAMLPQCANCQAEYGQDQRFAGRKELGLSSWGREALWGLDEARGGRLGPLPYSHPTPALEVSSKLGIRALQRSTRILELSFPPCSNCNKKFLLPAALLSLLPWLIHFIKMDFWIR